jgi:hypothetical protein
MNKNENVNLLWVSGQRGIWGNEKVDRAAKESLSFEEPMNTYSTAEVAVNFIKKRVWQRIQEEWISKQREMLALKPSIERYSDTAGLERR